MLAGCTIEVSPDARIPRQDARMKAWRSSVPQEGGTLLATPAKRPAGRPGAPSAAQAAGLPAATHLLVGDEAVDAAAQQGQQQQQQQQEKQQQQPGASAGQQEQQPRSPVPVPVHYSWLMGCLGKKRRLDEADYHPAALAAEAAAAAAAAAADDADGAQPAAGTAAQPSPLPAAVAAAAAASLGAAASDRPPPLRQLAVRLPLLMVGDVQHIILHLLGEKPRPMCLSVHGRPTTLVVLELPGLDHQLLLEEPQLMPSLRTARQQVALKATATLEVASQTTAALMAVGGGRDGGGGKKRKQPEGEGEQQQQQQQQQQQGQQQAQGGAQGLAGSAGGTARAASQQPPNGTSADSAPTAAQRAFPPQVYCTTARQMRVLGWPPGSAEEAEAAEAEDAAGSSAALQQRVPARLPPGWISTSQYHSGQAAGQAAAGGAGAGAGGEEPLDIQPVVCVDCEMVITTQGFELARVSLVDGAGRRLLDELVVPDHPILGHNTKYSGIDAAMLAGVRTRVADAQRMVLRFVGPRTLLVGHTLENDLKVLRLSHGRCLDSAVLFPNPGGLPYRSSLKKLAQMYLGQAIQDGAHDSCVDAEATLQAVQLKLRQGPTFGSTKEGSTHLLHLLATSKQRRRRVALVAPREMLMLHAVPEAHVVPAATDQAAAEAALRLLGAGQGAAGTAGGPAAGEQQARGRQQAGQGGGSGSSSGSRRPDLIWVQFGELWAHLESAAARAIQDGVPADLAGAVEAASQDATTRRLLSQADRLAGQLVAALPPGSLLLVVSGQGNTPLCRLLKGDSTRKADGTFNLQNAQRRAANASAPLKQLGQRAERGVCLLEWPGVGGGREGSPGR